MINAEHGNQPIIFLLEEDDDTRRPLTQSLRARGYRVIVAIDEEDALEIVDGGQVRADLVLVNLVEKYADDLLIVGRRVREHARYDGNTPLVVMPDRYGKEVEGTEVNVEGNDWVFYLGEEPDQLHDFLNTLLPAERAA